MKNKLTGPENNQREVEKTAVEPRGNSMTLFSRDRRDEEPSASERLMPKGRSTAKKASEVSFDPLKVDVSLRNCSETIKGIEGDVFSLSFAELNRHC